MKIVGVSFDSPEDNQKFAVAQNWAFELWSDTNKTMALHYGAAKDENQSLPSRVSMLLDDKGKLVLEYPKVDPGSHPQQVLEDCQALFGR